jgi:hypothetical protein
VSVLDKIDAGVGRDVDPRHEIVGEIALLAASTDAPAEFGAGQAHEVANGPKQGYLRVGVDIMLDTIDLDLWQENLRCDTRMSIAGPALFLQGIEVGDYVLPIGLIGKIDEHPGAVNEASGICEVFVETGVIPGDVCILHSRREVEPRTEPLLLPTMPASDGPILFSPAAVGWQAAQWD